MKDGIINIYKEEGMTSNDVVGIMKIILRIKKLGHTGTLDPMAKGVLPILINKGTRVAEYMDVDFKTYRAKMVFGVSTDTLDIKGEILEESSEEVNLDNIDNVLQSFLGLIDQMPPMYSAVRINGRKLYSYMHEAPKEEIDKIKEKVKERQVYIKNINLNEIGNIYLDEVKKELPFIDFTVTCSKGTYIRTLCSDIASKLGTFGCMISLERLGSGVFTKENSVTLSELKKFSIDKGLTYLENDRLRGRGELVTEINPIFNPYVFSLDFPLTNFGEVICSKEVACKFIDGWHLSYNEVNIVKEPSYEMIVDKELLRDANPSSLSNHHGSYPGLKVHPEYKKGYKVYDTDHIFLGVAFHNDTYKKLVADKVLVRNDSYR